MIGSKGDTTSTTINDTIKQLTLEQREFISVIRCTKNLHDAIISPVTMTAVDSMVQKKTERQICAATCKKSRLSK